MTDQECSKDKIYEQIGLNYRFFLNWRHGGLAGYLVLIYTLAQMIISLVGRDDRAAFMVTIAGFVLGIMFWVIDKRISSLFRVAIGAGSKLEQEMGVVGFFFAQESVGTIPSLHAGYPKFFSHTLVLSIIYLGSSFAFLCVGINLIGSFKIF